MPTVTTRDLVNRAKAASDMRDNFVTDTQWMYWATQERLALDMFLAQSGWPQSHTQGPLLVGAGTATGDYLVDTSVITSGGAYDYGMMAVIGVYEMSSNGYYRALKHEDNISFTRQVGGTAARTRGHSRYYRVKTRQDNDGIVFNLFPEPETSESYTVVYIAHPKRLSLDVGPADGYINTVTYPLGWEERIVLGMARRALMKEESETREIDKEIKLWDGRIEEACWSRVLGAVPAIRNIDRSERGWAKDLVYPPFTQWWWG